MPDTSIRTVIIPAAGKGTRLLPATKVTAKELLPIYDRVLLDFAIDEAVGIGAERIVIVISTAKIAIQEYLGGDGLRVGGNDNAPSDEIRGTGPEIVYVFQDRPLGLGHAVLCCRNVTLPGPFAVVLPDDVVMGPNCLAEMAAHYSEGHLVAAMQVRPEDASQYGIFQLSGLPNDRRLPVSGMVEKPTPGKAPSSFAAVGRYVLDPMIFDVLDEVPYGLGGKLQLTDAITTSARTVPVAAFIFSGVRYDCGNHDGLVAASVARQTVARQECAAGPTPASHSATPTASVNAIVAA